VRRTDSLEIPVQQFAHVEDLLGPLRGKRQLVGQGDQKLPLGGGHLTVAVDQLAGQGEGRLLLFQIQLGRGGGDQALPRLLPEALQQAGDQHPEGIGLHGPVAGSLQQLLTDHPGLLLAEGLIAADSGQGDGGEGF
jgi:hypothetical protein